MSSLLFPTHCQACFKNPHKLIHISFKDMDVYLCPECFHKWENDTEPVHVKQNPMWSEDAIVEPIIMEHLGNEITRKKRIKVQNEEFSNNSSSL